MIALLSVIQYRDRPMDIKGLLGQQAIKQKMDLRQREGWCFF